MSSPGRREGLGTKPEPSAKLGGRKRREPKDSGREVGGKKQVVPQYQMLSIQGGGDLMSNCRNWGKNTYAGWGWGVETRLQSARCEEMKGASADSPFKKSG